MGPVAIESSAMMPTRFVAFYFISFNLILTPFIRWIIRWIIFLVGRVSFLQSLGEKIFHKIMYFLIIIDIIEFFDVKVIMDGDLH